MDDPVIDQKVRECFLAQKLSEQSIGRILACGAKAKALHDKRSWWRYWMPVAAAAAMVAFVTFNMARRYDVSEFAYKVAGEIAMRHNGNRPFDVEARSFDAVQSGLKELAFSVTPAAKHALLSAYEIIGARYCWIEGQQAAHLRVRNRATGEICTLYITSLDGQLQELKRSSESHVDLAANHIDMWTDQDRLFALVK